MRVNKQQSNRGMNICSALTPYKKGKAASQRLEMWLTPPKHDAISLKLPFCCSASSAARITAPPQREEQPDWPHLHMGQQGPAAACCCRWTGHANVAQLKSFYGPFSEKASLLVFVNWEFIPGGNVS